MIAGQQQEAKGPIAQGSSDAAAVLLHVSGVFVVVQAVAVHIGHSARSERHACILIHKLSRRSIQFDAAVAHNDLLRQGVVAKQNIGEHVLMCSCAASTAFSPQALAS